MFQTAVNLFTMSSKCIFFFAKNKFDPVKKVSNKMFVSARWLSAYISQSYYRSSVKTGSSIDWLCSTCNVPQTESSPILANEYNRTYLLILKRLSRRSSCLRWVFYSSSARLRGSFWSKESRLPRRTETSPGYPSLGSSSQAGYIKLQKSDLGSPRRCVPA